MNYHAHYDKLIERARTRLLEGYGEWHHILPSCLGGSDDPENLVHLTAEEHYVAHQLLVKMHPSSYKLVYAANMMTVGRRSNKQYGWLRRKWLATHSKRQSEVMAGRVFTDEHKQAISEARTGYQMPESTKQKLSEYWTGRNTGKKNPMYGRSAVKGRKWYHSNTETHYLFPDDPQIEELNLKPGRSNQKKKWYNDGQKEYLLFPDDANGLELGRCR